MEPNGERCFRCKNFDAYYIKGTKKFECTKYGWCRAKKVNTERIVSCEKYEAHIYRSHALHFIEPCLNDILIELTEIRNIIEEESDENKSL